MIDVMNDYATFYTPEAGHTPLSNFYPSEIEVDGLLWATVEHYYQAMKTLDPAARERIRTAATPGVSKRLGRRVDLRPDWEAVKIPVMRRALAHKFTHETEAGHYLLESGDGVLIEGNTWGDRFWGVDGGVGENWLGHLLMARRAELRGSF